MQGAEETAADELSTAAGDYSEVIPLPEFAAVSTVPAVMRAVSPEQYSAVGIPIYSHLRVEASASVSDLRTTEPSAELLQWTGYSSLPNVEH